jgi:hypothetical protein
MSTILNRNIQYIAYMLLTAELGGRSIKKRYTGKRARYQLGSWHECASWRNLVMRQMQQGDGMPNADEIDLPQSQTGDLDLRGDEIDQARAYLASIENVPDTRKESGGG